MTRKKKTSIEEMRKKWQKQDRRVKQN
jgi:hypothetical protein